jgi:hypothetical protein
VDDFERVLARLRRLRGPCLPPVGVGQFDVLYASPAEVVVWYSPAREGHRAGEVAIPCGRLEAAWAALRGGAALDEPELERLGAGPAGGRWLLALLVQLPGVRARGEPLQLTLAAGRRPTAAGDGATEDGAAPAPARREPSRAARRGAGDG